MHQWDPPSDKAWQFPENPQSPWKFPARDRAHFSSIVEKMGLPVRWFWICGRKKPVPATVTSETSASGEPRIGVLCQTPAFDDFFTTFACSHDPKSGYTIGMLCFVKGRMARILDLIPRVSEHAALPLSIPTLIFMTLIGVSVSEILRSSLSMFIYAQTLTITQIHGTQFRNILTWLEHVKRATGMLDGSSTEATLDNYGRGRNTIEEHYDHLHRILLKQHSRLTMLLTDYVDLLGRSLISSLKHIRHLYPKFKCPFNLSLHRRFEHAISHLISDGDWRILTRRKCLWTIDVLLRVLYNLMQQRMSEQARADNSVMQTIASNTRRDSREMKGIAWLTMTFLPMTAVAVRLLSLFYLQLPH